jgi:hypothetical protein
MNDDLIIIRADLYQIALLIDQLRHEDPALRVAAASRLEDIGEKYACSELWYSDLFANA